MMVGIVVSVAVGITVGIVEDFMVDSAMVIKVDRVVDTAVGSRPHVQL